jgi:hypothetical protein
MYDSTYTIMQSEAARLETEIARLTDRLAAARAFIASYAVAEPAQRPSYDSGTDSLPVSREPVIVEPNGYADIRMPQVANGHRIRPGTIRYKVDEAMFNLLKVEKSLHRKEIAHRLRDHEHLVRRADPLAFVSILLSQAKGIFVSDGGGQWSIDPALLIKNEQEKEGRSAQD